MSKAVRFNQYGGLDVLQVVEVERPAPGPGQVLIRVRAAGINPGEAAVRQGAFHDIWPATFPTGQGSDFAGTVEALGGGVVGFAEGEAVIGFSNDRASQAEFVAVPAGQLTPKPGNVPWEVAGALFVAGTTAYAAVRAVNLQPGDTVAVSGASGGVGAIAAQLALRAGARVLGIASPGRHGWLTDHGILPVAYGEGLEDRLRSAAGGQLDALIDTFGGGYVELAIKLGVKPERIDTIIDFSAAQQYGVKAEGSAEAASADVLALLAGLIDQGLLEVPIAHAYPLADVQEAYRELEKRHTLGKIVLVLTARTN